MTQKWYHIALAMTEKQPVTTQPGILIDTDGVKEGDRVRQQELGNTDGREKLPVGLKVLRDAQEVTVKQHIDSVEGIQCAKSVICWIYDSITGR